MAGSVLENISNSFSNSRISVTNCKVPFRSIGGRFTIKDTLSRSPL